MIKHVATAMKVALVIGAVWLLNECDEGRIRRAERDLANAAFVEETCARLPNYCNNYYSGLLYGTDDEQTVK